jgi:hypothetical protein
MSLPVDMLSHLRRRRYLRQLFMLSIIVLPPENNPVSYAGKSVQFFRYWNLARDLRNLA